MVMDDAFLGVANSFTGRRWRVRRCDDRTALALAQRLTAPEIVGRVLAARCVPVEDAESFLTPRLRSMMPDPACLLDMERAAERLAAAIERSERIVLFGDYDVDGAASTALLHRFLRAVGVAADIYIPDRIEEGYGPNVGAMLSLK